MSRQQRLGASLRPCYRARPMPYAVSDQEHYVRCLRVYAVLLERGVAVEVTAGLSCCENAVVT